MTKQHDTMVDYYQLLEIPINADIATIKQAYRAKITLHHPDRKTDRQQADDEMVRLLNIAYETLKDGDRRTQYDIELARHRHQIRFMMHRQKIATEVGAKVGTMVKKAGDKIGKTLHERLPEHLTHRAGVMANQAVRSVVRQAKRLLAQVSSVEPMPCQITLPMVYHGGEVQLSLPSGVVKVQLPMGLSEGEVITVKHNQRAYPLRIRIDAPNVRIQDNDVHLSIALNPSQIAQGDTISLPSPIDMRLSLPANHQYPATIILTGKGLSSAMGVGDVYVHFVAMTE